MLQPGFGNLPLAFEPNLGQAGAGTAFVARGQGYGIELGSAGTTLDLQKPAGPNGTAYTSPAGDNGTLSGAGSNYQFTAPGGEVWNFNSAGQETSLVSPDGQSIITYTYASGNLSSLATPDGALTTFSYEGSLITASRPAVAR